MQDFNSFIQSLLSNPNPQGGMMGGGGNQPNRQFYDQAGNDAYYQNPYRMQDSIDAGMLKRKEADAAMAAAMGQQMPQTNGGGSDGYGMQLSPEQIAFLDAETLDQRGARIQNDFAKLFNPIPSLVGMLSGPPREGPNAPVVDSSSYSAAAKAEQARQQEFNNSLMVSENSKRAAAQAAQQEAAAQAAIQSQAQAYFAAQNTSSGNNSNDSYGGYGGFSGRDAGGGGFGPSSAGGM